MGYARHFLLSVYDILYHVESVFSGNRNGVEKRYRHVNLAASITTAKRQDGLCGGILFSSFESVFHSSGNAVPFTTHRWHCVGGLCLHCVTGKY